MQRDSIQKSLSEPTLKGEYESKSRFWNTLLPQYYTASLSLEKALLAIGGEDNPSCMKQQAHPSIATSQTFLLGPSSDCTS